MSPPTIDLHRLLFLEPMKGQTAFSFWETIVFHVMLVGNAFVYISRGAGDRILELILLQPNRVTVTQHADMSLVYDVTGEDQVQRRFTSRRDLAHPRAELERLDGHGDGAAGARGARPVARARGIARAAAQGRAEAQRHLFGRGQARARPARQLTKWIKDRAAGDPLILDRGAKWLDQQLTGVDTQHLETRRFQIEEVCRVVRVMPIMIGLADKVATYSSSEQMFLAHEEHTLAPGAGRIEQSVEVGLLSEAEQREGSTRSSISPRSDARRLQDAAGRSPDPAP
jgi:HK97 family phage portal protein